MKRGEMCERQTCSKEKATSLTPFISIGQSLLNLSPLLLSTIRVHVGDVQICSAQYMRVSAIMHVPWHNSVSA